MPSSHKYMQLPLIPKEEFLALRPEHAEADEDALTVARIEYEHAEREALEQQRQGLLKKKQGLIADNKKRKDDLANLDKQLENFIDVCYLCVESMGKMLTRKTGCQTYSEDAGEGCLKYVADVQKKMDCRTDEGQ